MQVPDCGFESFAGLRGSPSRDLPASIRTQWHHGSYFVGAVITASDDPSALAAHAKTGDVNPVLIDTYFAFDVRKEPFEGRGIPFGNRFNRRDENITDEIGNVSTIACVGG